MGCKALEPAAQRSGGVTILAIVKKSCRCGTWGNGLMVNMVLVQGWWLDSMILEIFSTFNDPRIAFFIQTFYRHWKSVCPPAKAAETKLSKGAPLPQQQQKKQTASSGALWNRDLALQRGMDW